MIQNESNPTEFSNSSSALEIPQWTIIFDIAWLCVYMTELAVGFFGNMLTVIAICKFEKLTTKPSNILIASLSLADCINFLAAPFECILFFPVSNIETSRGKKVMNIACYLLTVFGIVSFYGNACHIFIIALERFLSINFPLKALQIITLHSVKRTCAFVWFMIFVKLGADFVFLNNGMGFENCLWTNVFKPGVYNFTIVVPFLVISICTLLLYARIFYIAIVSSRKSLVQVNSSFSFHSGKILKWLKDKCSFKQVFLFSGNSWSKPSCQRSNVSLQEADHKDDGFGHGILLFALYPLCYQLLPHNKSCA